MELASDGLLGFLVIPTWGLPLWRVILGMAVAMAVLWTVSMLLRFLTPKVGAIAWTTAKEALSQPLFYVLLAIGIFALLLFPYIPYNTFGEDVKMLKSEGLTFIKVLAIILALWTASISIADEIEGRTSLTLLSKPISRRQLIVGKFLGIVGPVAVVFILLGSLFLCTVSYKVVYDARETANPEPAPEQCVTEMAQIVPGLALSLFEVIILTSVSVAISTRLPMLPNLLICFSVYVLGHLVPLLVASSAGQFPMVDFVAQFFATVLPVLEHFNMEAPISTSQKVPWSYVAWSACYASLYCLAAMFLALLLFEDRDLA